jgi:menaquinone-dependent protoporphyrinogen oxidase
MADKILVTYSTRTGATKGVSEAIGQTLTALGENVDVIPMQEVSDLKQYKAVIAGSAIQSAKWLPEAMEFIQSNKHELNRKPFAAFMVCMTLAMPKGESYRAKISSWLAPIRNLVTPVSEGIFSGTLDISKIPTFSERLRFRISVMFGIWKEGDHRDWEEVRVWSKDLKDILVK